MFSYFEGVRQTALDLRDSECSAVPISGGLVALKFDRMIGLAEEALRVLAA